MSNHDSEIQKEALDWLRFAKEDLDAASHLMNTAFSPRHACWLCQQSTEKAIKAALILEAIEFPPVHDLDILRSLLPKGWDVLYRYGDLYDLTEWAVEARYPGDWPDPTHADAIQAESKARSVYSSVADEFKHRGCLFDPYLS